MVNYVRSNVLKCPTCVCVGEDCWLEALASLMTPIYRTMSPHLLKWIAQLLLMMLALGYNETTSVALGKSFVKKNHFMVPSFFEKWEKSFSKSKRTRRYMKNDQCGLASIGISVKMYWFTSEQYMFVHWTTNSTVLIYLGDNYEFEWHPFQMSNVVSWIINDGVHWRVCSLIPPDCVRASSVVHKSTLV